MHSVLDATHYAAGIDNLQLKRAAQFFELSSTIDDGVADFVVWIIQQVMPEIRNDLAHLTETEVEQVASKARTAEMMRVLRILDMCMVEPRAEAQSVEADYARRVREKLLS